MVECGALFGVSSVSCRRHRGVARPLCRRDRGAVAAALRLGVTRQAVLCVARTHLLGCPHEWGLMTHCSGRGPATLPLQCHGRPSDLKSNKEVTPPHHHKPYAPPPLVKHILPAHGWVG